jgi:hypothetical protein
MGVGQGFELYGKVPLQTGVLRATGIGGMEGDIGSVDNLGFLCGCWKIG